MTTTVLVVEDNRADARLLQEILGEVPGRPFVLAFAQDLAAAIPLAESCDVVLLDLSLPDAHGRETVERMVAAARSKPIVVLTGNDDEAAALEALKAGAQDYLLKLEISPATVARSIKYAVERKRVEAAEVARTRSEKAAEHATFVASALHEVTRALDLGSAVACLARAVLPRLGDLCIIDLLEDGGGTLPVGFAGLCAAREELGGAETTWRVEDVVTKRKAVVFSARDGDGDLDERHRALATRFGAHSFLIAPLVARERVIGTISVAQCREGADFGADELLLAEEVASHAALAIDNARLYEQTRRAVQARDELLAIVSHDLRNPMNVMSLALNLIEPGGGDGPRALYVDRVRRALDRMQRLIDDLLDVARVDSGTLEVAMEPVEVSGVLEDAMLLFLPIAAEKKILLVRDFDPIRGVGRANIDAGRIAQVLSNLLGNAMKFTPAGGTIHLGAHCISDDELRIEVRDSGPGIGAEHLPHVFDRFWQRERRSGGVGLGLAIAKGIVEAHGGTIHVDSAPGLGACFWFTVARAGGDSFPGAKVAV